VRNARVAVDTVHPMQLALDLLPKVGRQAGFHVKVFNDLPVRANLAHVRDGLLERVISIEPDLILDVPVNAAPQPSRRLPPPVLTIK